MHNLHLGQINENYKQMEITRLYFDSKREIPKCLRAYATAHARAKDAQSILAHVLHVNDKRYVNITYVA